MRARLSILTLLVLLARPCLADGPPPLAGWSEEQLPRVSPPQPLEIQRERRRALEAESARLLLGQDYERLGRLLLGRTRNAALRGRVIATARGQTLGCWSDAWARLRRWPEARASLQRALDAEAQELARTPTPAAQRALVARFPLASVAPATARALGERAFEAGQVEAAAAWWRRALELGLPEASARTLRRRLRALRGRETGAPRPPGHWGAIASAPAPRLVWARHAPGGLRGWPPWRVGAADEQSVYLLERGYLVACARQDGRLRWRSEAPLGWARELALGHDLVVHAGTARLSARDAGQGGERWQLALDPAELDPGDGFQHLVATPGGFVASLRRAGRWEVWGVGPEGKPRWKTTLWDAGPEVTQGLRWDLERPHVKPATAARRVLSDGRLAALADAVALTIEGRVLLLGAELGEIRWARERLVGVGLGGRGPVRVALRLGAWGVEALTAHGLFVRLDPASGRDLALPPIPHHEGKPTRGYLFSSDPPLVGWAAPQGLRLVSAGGSFAQDLEVAPSWRGAALGDLLALPAGDELSWRPLAAGAAAPPLRWPLGPARLQPVPGGLLLLSTEGAALVERSAPGETAPAGFPSSLAEQVGALGARSWRLRHAAWEALADRLSKDPAAERSAWQALTPLRGARQLEASWSLGALIARARVQRLWTQVFPTLPWSQLEAATSDPSGAALRALAPQVAATPAAAEALRRAAASALSWEQRLALLDLLLRADPALEGRLTALARNSQSPGVQRAASDLLVRLAASGGSRRGLQLVLRGQRGLGGIPAALPSLARWGTAELWRAVRPKDFEQMPFGMLAPFVKQVGASGPDPAGLWKALGPAIAPRGQ